MANATHHYPSAVIGLVMCGGYRYDCAILNVDVIKYVMLDGRRPAC